MTFIGGLNQFCAVAKLTLIQHLLERKIKIYPFTLSTHKKNAKNDRKLKSVVHLINVKRKMKKSI